MNIRVNTCPWFIVAQFKLRQMLVKWLHTSLKKPIAYSLVYAGILLRFLQIKKYGLKILLKGRRVDSVSIADKVISRVVHNSSLNNSKFEELLGADLTAPVERFDVRVLMLKLPVLAERKIIEKGVIIFKFSETFAPVYQSLDIKLLAKYFNIVLEPSSVGYSLPEILVWSTLSPEKIIVLSPYKNDFELLENVTNNLIPVASGPADWADTSKFYTIKGVSKTYDSIYVANFNPIKRVERYIQAVTRINRKRPDYRAALVCAGFGSAKKEVLAALECAKPQTAALDYFTDVNQVRLNELINKSKVNILISLREGANKGLAEGLFSGTPALLIKENVGGNHLHINDQTGRLVPDEDLENALIWFSENHVNFSPREWALENISPEASTHLLEEKLKEIEISEGRKWGKGLFVKINNPELNYLDGKNSWLLDKRAKLLRVFSIGTEESAIIELVEELQTTAERQSVTN